MGPTGIRWSGDTSVQVQVLPSPHYIRPKWFVDVLELIGAARAGGQEVITLLVQTHAILFQPAGVIWNISLTRCSILIHHDQNAGNHTLVEGNW